MKERDLMNLYESYRKAGPPTRLPSGKVKRDRLPPPSGRPELRYYIRERALAVAPGVA